MLKRLLKMLNNERGCFSKPKTPDLPPTPAPQPTPSPAALPGEVQASAESKRRRLEALKMSGMQAGIKNIYGAAGTTGAELATPSATAKKKTLGS